MGDLLYSILVNFVSRESAGSKDAYSLSKVKVEMASKKAEDINFGNKANSILEELKKTPGQNLDCCNMKTDMRKFYIRIVELLQKHLPLESIFLKNCKYIDPKNKNDSKAPKALSYLGEKIGECLKSTLGMSVSDWVNAIESEFNFYLLEKDIPDYNRLDEYWWNIYDFVVMRIEHIKITWRICKTKKTLHRKREKRLKRKKSL